MKTLTTRQFAQKAEEMPTLALYGTPVATKRRGDKHDASRQQESVGEEAIDEGEGVVAGGAVSELPAASVRARKGSG
ncbi:hypothetical protein NL676_006667 [Syzygium grande]|nr:hypothetical protein NL676_006667 [Syzygium grande]